MDKYQVLKQHFGYDQFREGQEILIDSILEGKDTLGIMPTGSGKSLCFQIPSLIMGGISIIISPLISLMKDQVAALNQAGIYAAYLNSSLTFNQYQKVILLAKEGRYPIIYVAPERLMTPEFLEFALNAPIDMIAVDEAHCVSQWGQDFRPSYLKIVEFISKLPKRPVISAFTATATKEVKEDVIDILMLREPVLVSTGYDRPNLYLGVQSPKDKYSALKNYIECHPDQWGIIYCLTRKLVEEICEKLERDGFSTTRYHAGLSDEERRNNQDDFIYDRKQIMVATNAFGMGIDKSNVRFVIHYNMPKNIESYYQEAGRCSRDGEPGDCILFYSGSDVVTNQRFIELNEDNQELDPVTKSIVIERDRERLKKMTFYCFTSNCLRDYILGYFGEYGANYCGNCINCLTRFEEIDVTDIGMALIECVYGSYQRYGTNVIIDTVRGANTAKIRQYHMDSNACYGKLANVPVYTIRKVLNHLLLEGYLRVTNDEYSIVKLTEKSHAIFNNYSKVRNTSPLETELQTENRMIMKMPKVSEPSASIDKKAKNKKSSIKSKITGVSLDEAGEELFQKFRALRLEIARKEKVPPYIIFSDKTLLHMCITKPKNKEEMLAVSGVGEYKYEKYGTMFLEIIPGFKSV